MPFHIGFIVERTTPRMATSGALTIGVKCVPPMPPSEEIENVAARDVGRGELAVAHLLRNHAEFLAEFKDALAIGILDHRHDQPVGRIDRDADVEVLLEIRFSLSGASEALKSGYSFSAATLALIRNGSIVTR